MYIVNKDKMNKSYMNNKRKYKIILFLVITLVLPYSPGNRGVGDIVNAFIIFNLSLFTQREGGRRRGERGKKPLLQKYPQVGPKLSTTQLFLNALA